MRSLLLFIFFVSGNCFSQKIPANVTKLLQAYPEQITGFKDNKIWFKDGSFLLYDDGKQKTPEALLANPDIEDQFLHRYALSGRPGNDPGRIRNEAFFKKIYGDSKLKVQSKLIEVIWCPKLVNQKIRVTSVNGLDKIVRKLSAELDSHPEFKKYVSAIGGTFNWRKISGTDRLSMHSFGMTIDINVRYSHYWQWDCKCNNERVKLDYKNRVPMQLVRIFEKYGFIWGGNWYHYDTMHFEYRPELLN